MIAQETSRIWVIPSRKKEPIAHLRAVLNGIEGLFAGIGFLLLAAAAAAWAVDKILPPVDKVGAEPDGQKRQKYLNSGVQGLHVIVLRQAAVHPVGKKKL